MSIIASSYKSPFYFFNGHAETIIPSLFRKINNVGYQRERLELSDGDFIDLDWFKDQRDKLVIISHGLEGNSERHYSKGMARNFFNHGWDAVAWNCRSCSGEINRLPRFYHHGDTEDLKAVVDHAITLKYKSIVLVSFSMGGSMALRYVGEKPEALPSQVKATVNFSVPCDLGSSAKELDKRSKKFYRDRFLKKLGKKIAIKSKLFPDVISHKNFDLIKTFEEFDNRYTAPLHGFESASDFYAKASCGQFLQSIRIPSLIVNAKNDPFLPEACYPITIAQHHAYVHLEIPDHGGHVGFPLFRSELNWMEIRALQFVTQLLQPGKYS